MKCSNHVLHSFAVTGFKTYIYWYKSVTENYVTVEYDAESHRMRSSTTLLWKFKTFTFVPVPPHLNTALERVYCGHTAAVMDINMKLQFARFE
jgi:hypothetical protein